MLRPRTPLFNAATDAGQTGGGTPTVETPTTTPAPKPGVIDSAISMFRDKGAITAQITTLKADNGKLTAEVSTLRTELAKVTAERNTLQGEFTRLETALATANAEKKTVQTEVTHQLATAGVPEAHLPKGNAGAAAAATAETSAEVWAAAEKESDPVKKGQLAAKALKLQTKELA